MRIKFDKCPIGEHRGESWEKIADREVGDVFTTFRVFELNKYDNFLKHKGESYNVLDDGEFVGRATLMEIDLVDGVSLVEIMNDMFPDTSSADFDEAIAYYYGHDDIPLVKFTFEWTEVV